MKKLSLVLGVLVVSTTNIYGQTPNNVPTNGNVGLGTNTPTKKLEVLGETELNGRVIMDSSLIVKDSAQFDKDVRVKKRFTVEEKSFFFDDVLMKKRLIVDDRGIFKENVVVNQNIRVDGNARVFGNQKNDGRLIVDSLSRFKDKVVMEGDVIMNSLDTLPNFNNRDFLFVTPNGKVERGNRDFIIDGIAQQMYQPSICFQDGNGNVFPTWKNKPDVLYVSCNTSKVGVGKSNPGSKLDVNGQTRTTSLMAGIVSPTFATFNAFRQVGTINNQFPVARIGSYESQTEKERFTFYSDGALHINHEGTNNVLEISNPQRKLLQLQADGLLRAREIQVDLQTWPDYVFSQQYKLMPLEDIKEYIELNKHLPGVPSEQEVRENGVNLGEMNKILLEKVEEMTLYLIDQDETIKAQQKILEKQQQQIELLMQKLDSGVKEGGQ